MPDQSRRKFIDILLSAGIFAWLGSVFYPIAKFLVPPKIADANITSVEVGAFDDIPPDTSKIIRFGRLPIIVVHQKSGEFTALSATCTHLDCTVQYKQDTEQIWCACHNGLYDLQGRNISGPPPKPLTQFKVSVVNKKIIVTREDIV